jgi:hypothetical protein
VGRDWLFNLLQAWITSENAEEEEKKKTCMARIRREWGKEGKEVNRRNRRRTPKKRRFGAFVMFMWYLQQLVREFFPTSHTKEVGRRILRGFSKVYSEFCEE